MIDELEEEPFATEPSLDEDDDDDEDLDDDESDDV
jgi:hypothetical protein